MTAAATSAAPTSAAAARGVLVGSDEAYVGPATVVRRDLRRHEGAVATRLVADPDPVVAVELATATGDESGTRILPVALRWPVSCIETTTRCWRRRNRKTEPETSDPAAFETRIGPVPAPEGTRARTCTSEITSKTAWRPLNRTDVVPVKPLPVIVTSCR